MRFRCFASWSVAAALALAAPACSGPTHPPIVGKWLTPRAEVVEFKPDGSVVESKFGNVLLTGTYRWVDSGTLEIHGESFGKPVVSRLTVAKEGNALSVQADGAEAAEQFTHAP